MRLAFAGTPATALPALRRLLDSDRHEVTVVITRPPARAGRGRTARSSTVQQQAERAGVPVLAPERPGDEAFLAELRAFDIDCCAVVAYGALLPPAALAVPRHGWVNLHFSLLPAWRGAAPVQHAILHGDEITGASTFLIEPGLDTGPVYGVLTEPIRPTDTAGELLERLADSGADLLAATMDGIADGSLRARPQSAEGISAAPRLTPQHARIDWSAPALHVDRLVRACTPQPGAWTTWRGQRLRIGPVRPVAGADAAPGEVVAGKQQVTAGTATGAVELGWVQPPGKRATAAADWARGARPEAGERFA